MIYHNARSWVFRFSTLVLLLECFSLANSAKAQLILHRTTVDLIDVVPGSDRWAASYSLDGPLPRLNQGFTVFFDAALYRDLIGPTMPVGSAWDPLLIQPDGGLSAAGFFDALALTDMPSYTGPFTIEFILLGGGEPGGQDYELYTLDPSFSVLQTGRVGAAAVPESASLGMVLVLVLFVIARRALRLRRNPPLASMVGSV